MVERLDFDVRRRESATPIGANTSEMPAHRVSTNSAKHRQAKGSISVAGRQNFGPGREIPLKIGVNDDKTDKAHPPFHDDAAELVDLFGGFEPVRPEDEPRQKSGPWHWHMSAGRRI